MPPRRVHHKAPPLTSATTTSCGTGPFQGAGTDADDIYPLRLWKPSQGNKDPRAAYDFAMQDAAALLSDKPTLPEHLHAANDPEMAYDLLDYHCASRSCGFKCATQAALAEHAAQHHAAALYNLALRWSSRVDPTPMPQLQDPSPSQETHHKTIRGHRQGQRALSIFFPFFGSCGSRWVNMGQHRPQDGPT